MNPVPLEELMQLEYHVETGFQGSLETACPNVYHSREIDITRSPRIEVKCIVGKTQRHQHRFPSGALAYDVFDGKLEVTTKTNRTGEAKSEAHRKLLGQVRSRLQLFAIVREWRKWQDAILVTDIREDGTDDSVLDTEDLDVTRIAWYLLFNINPEAWPTNL